MRVELRTGRPIQEGALRHDGRKAPTFQHRGSKRLAGGAFVRGEAYHREGRVEILAVEPRRVLARVTGTDDYRDYDGLSGILDRFAELEGDVEARIALRAKDLSSPWKYLELAEFCLRHRSANEALRWAEEGLWTFEDGPSDARLVLFAANLLMKADRRGKAEGVLKRAFERAPDFNVYTRWREAGGEAARDQALAVVERWAAAETGPSFGHPADPGLKILMHEKRFDMAWAMTRKHRVSRAVKESLARESEADQFREIAGLTQIPASCSASRALVAPAMSL